MQWIKIDTFPEKRTKTELEPFPNETDDARELSQHIQTQPSQSEQIAIHNCHVIDTQGRQGNTDKITQNIRKQEASPPKEDTI